MAIAVYYASSSALDYIRIYISPRDEHMYSEPVFYNEYPEFPLISVTESIPCKYTFKTQEGYTGFAYENKYISDYIQSAYGWTQTDYSGGYGGYYELYEKSGQKMCISHGPGNEMYVFGYSGDIKNEYDILKILDESYMEKQ